MLCYIGTVFVEIFDSEEFGKVRRAAVPGRAGFQWYQLVVRDPMELVTYEFEGNEWRKLNYNPTVPYNEAAALEVMYRERLKH